MLATQDRKNLWQKRESDGIIKINYKRQEIIVNVDKGIQLTKN